MAKKTHLCLIVPFRAKNKSSPLRAVLLSTSRKEKKIIYETSKRHIN